MTKQNEKNPTKAMNMVLIGMTAGTLLLGAYNAGVNSGVIPTSNSTKTEAIIKQNTMEMKKMSAQLATNNAKNTQRIVKAISDENIAGNAYTDGDTVYEKFEIDELVENEIHGEPVVGTGEGISYNVQQLFDKGLDNIYVGDVVEIGWNTKDYENEDWDKIASVKKISSAEGEILPN